MHGEIFKNRCLLIPQFHCGAFGNDAGDCPYWEMGMNSHTCRHYSTKDDTCWSRAAKSDAAEEYVRKWEEAQ